MNKESIEKRLSDHALTAMAVILGVAVAVSLVAVGLYVVIFHGHPLAETPDRWGQFGDFLGGALNPLFGFLSVLALLVTLVLQSRELRLSTKELRNSSKALKGQNKAIGHQSFEQTFFAWLNNYHELLQSVSTADAVTGVRSGRAALYGWWSPVSSSSLVFDKVYEQFSGRGGNSAYNEWVASLRHRTESESTEAAVARLEGNIAPAVLREWNAVYLKHEYQLDSLFRNLYRLILWIDSQHEEQLTKAQKWLYVGIVRGQLSWIEQVYLFYNGLTERGGKFRQLVNKYALFDNLTFENDPVLESLRDNQPPEVAYEERAFSSVLARRALGLPATAEETMARAAADSRPRADAD